MFYEMATALRSSLARLQREGEPFIRRHPFPAALTIKLKQRFPDWSEQTVERVLVGLRQYFLICLDATDTPVPMPSKAVDAAWHEFILFTRAYCYFCDRAYGTYLHHTPTERPMHPDSAQIELGRLWYLHCLRSGQHPLDPSSVPLLLTIDAELGLSDLAPPRIQELAALPLPVGMLDPRTGNYVPGTGDMQTRSSRRITQSTSGGGCSAGGCGGGSCSGGGCGGGGGGS